MSVAIAAATTLAEGTAPQEPAEESLPLPSLLTGRPEAVAAFSDGPKAATGPIRKSPPGLTLDSGREGQQEANDEEYRAALGKEPLVSIDSSSTKASRRGEPEKSADSENEASGQSGDSETQSELQTPPTTPPGDGPALVEGDLPSVGSALHASGRCSRCCFYLKGRCRNGAGCQFCHLQHEKRSRGRGCRGHATSGKAAKKEELARGDAAAPPRPPAFAAPPGLDSPAVAPVPRGPPPPGLPAPGMPTPNATPVGAKGLVLSTLPSAASVQPPQQLQPPQLPPFSSPRGVAPQECGAEPAAPETSPRCSAPEPEAEAAAAGRAGQHRAEPVQRENLRGCAPPAGRPNGAGRVLVPRDALELKRGGMLFATPAPAAPAAPAKGRPPAAAPAPGLLATAAPAPQGPVAANTAGEASRRARRSPSPERTAAAALVALGFPFSGPPAARGAARGEVAGACRLPPLLGQGLCGPLTASAAAPLCFPGFPNGLLHSHPLLVPPMAHAHFQASVAAMMAARSAAFGAACPTARAAPHAVPRAGKHGSRAPKASGSGRK